MFVPPRKTLALNLCKTPSSLGAHYVSGFKTVGVCAFFLCLKKPPAEASGNNYFKFFADIA